MVNSDILIEARGLTRRFGPNVAVDNVSLQLAQGEILGLLGPNGAGKSTTMKMLTGNLAPSDGEVLIHGQSLRDHEIQAKQQLGYLPEQPPVYPELTVDEYLRYCAGLHGISRKDCAEAMASAKRDCGLSEVGRRVIGNLSKGFQQRVGLAQAIIHRPPVVVLDEPTVGLDPIQIREIRSLIRNLGANHSVIQAVCSRVVIISRGKLVYDAPTDRQAEDSAVIIQLARAPELSELASVSGVARVTAQENGQFTLNLNPGADPRESLVKLAVKHDWGLQELRLQSKTLEEIFVELTSGEVASEAAYEEAA